MSIETTAPSAAETQRRGHMAALQVAAHILSGAPIPPTSVTVECPPFAPEAPSVHVHFHGPTGVDGVEQLADALDETVTIAPFGDDDPRPYTSVDAIVEGIPVHAWHLGEKPKPEDEQPAPNVAASAARLRNVLAPVGGESA